MEVDLIAARLAVLMYCIRKALRVHDYRDNVRTDAHTKKYFDCSMILGLNECVFNTNYRLMQVKSIAECSLRSILQYFDMHLATFCH